jgi:hypothetical protein
MEDISRTDKQLLMFYVCEYSDDRPLQFLAGPYATEAEAVAAAGAYEVEHPEFRMRTFVWTCRAGRDSVSRRYDATAEQPVIPPVSGAMIGEISVGGIAQR